MGKVNHILLPDGHYYSGYGYQNGFNFIPNGFGKKEYTDMCVTGNFVDGVLCGPSLSSHGYYMYTMNMKSNRGNGWGLCINGGMLIEFGYYKNSQLQANLLDAVDWYYRKMTLNPRDESMSHFYTSKVDGHLVEIHVGWSGTPPDNGVSLCYIGFHFMDDGSVWVGTSATRRQTGTLVKFIADGYIQVGEFENGELVRPMDIQEVIDSYYGKYKFSDDDLFSSLFAGRKKSDRESEREKIRHEYDNVTIDANKNYSE